MFHVRKARLRCIVPGVSPVYRSPVYFPSPVYFRVPGVFPSPVYFPITENGGKNVYAIVKNALPIMHDFLGLEISYEIIKIPVTGMPRAIAKFYSPVPGGVRGYTSVPDWDKNVQLGQVTSKVTRSANGMVYVMVDQLVEPKITGHQFLPDESMIGIDNYYTSNGLSEIVAHENRRLDVYKRGFDEYFKKAVDYVKKCEVCGTDKENAHTKLKKLIVDTYVESWYAFLNYYTEQQTLIGAENTRQVFHYGSIYDPPLGHPDAELVAMIKLFDSFWDVHQVEDPAIKFNQLNVPQCKQKQKP